MVKTAEIPLGNLGWIIMDKESTWYNVLYCVALSLICQNAVMSVNKIQAKIFLIAHNNLLRTVPTFSNRFTRLTAESKSQLVIVNIPLDLAQAHLQVHKYNSDPEVELLLPWFAASFHPSTPPLTLKLTLN